MGLRPLDPFLLRAPLLPVAALGDAERRLLAHPLGRRALALAGGDGAWKPALGRWARRAALRPTPSGLLAGVTMGRLGPRTRVDTGRPRADVTVAWGALASLGRGLLEDPAVRAGARLRRAPSACRPGGAVVWLGFGVDDDGAPFEMRAEVDDPLARVLDAVENWTEWAAVRDAARAGDGSSDDDIDEWLLGLVDDGLLAHDLCPPLCGPRPAAWMRERLRRMPAPVCASAEAALDTLVPGEGGAAPARGAWHAVLVHQPPRPPAISRRAVERAAAAAPLLFRLQEALSPPGAERDVATAGALGDALTATTEIFGAGALDLAALAAGDYGVDPADGEDGAQVEPPPASQPVVRHLADRLLAAARAGDEEVALDRRALDVLLPAAPPPPTFELFLSPAREPHGAPPGTGWLLGLHAPAGATWGRFAHALGGPMREALGEIAAAEAAGRPGEQAVDVAYAPGPDLGDVCAHPPIRATALALSSWPDGVALTPADLEVVADPSAAEPLALRRRGGTPISPSPLHRVRSATAPSGIFRLLCGFALGRQHAPWALALGPLANLERTPRVTIDGFVVAPRSWRVPDGVTRRGRLARWRREARVPRWIQIGHEDELLPVDLDHPGAAAEIGRYPRAFEIVPDGEPVDARGRRVEAVVAVVVEPEPDQRAAITAAIAATAAAGAVPAPRADPAPGWRTFKLYGAADRQDAVLAAAVAPSIAAARAGGEADRWFFQRFEDGPGRRPHLRVRVRAPAPGGLDRFAARLGQAIAPSRAVGDIVTIETTEYHPETARLGGPAAVAAAERIFEAESDLACTLLAERETGAAGPGPDGCDPVELVVRAFDRLAEGLGVDREGRRALARRRRDAHRDDVAPTDLDADFRARQKRLRVLLGATPGDAAGRALAAHAATVADAVRGLEGPVRGRMLPVLLHLCAVRLGGADASLEARAYAFWERTLEGLLRHAVSR